MRKFSDMGIQQQEDKKIFDCDQVSISEVINCEIEVLDFIPNVTTAHVEGRYLVKCKHDGKERKFFTNSTAIKSCLDQVSEDDFPFATTIRCTKCGKGKIYQFT